MKTSFILLLKLLLATMLVAFGAETHGQQVVDSVAKPAARKSVHGKAAAKAAENAAPEKATSGPVLAPTPTLSTGTAYLPLAGGTMLGPLQLAADPLSSTQAATKNYVDGQVSTTLPITGGTVQGPLAMQLGTMKGPLVNVRHPDFAGGADPTGTKDSLPAIQAAITYAMAQAAPGTSAFATVYIPQGLYKINGTINMPMALHLVGDGKGSTVLQEINPTANLITAKRSGFSCFTSDCSGGIEKMVLRGGGKTTTGTLLEIQGDTFTLREVHFYNSAGRGLQMNNSAERIGAYDLSFYYVRWPLVMAGDTNENYFYNTHIWGAGATDEAGTGAPYTGNNCYSVNCVNGMFKGPGTAANPTVLYPEAHAAVYIDKAVNVGFIGGTIKASTMLSAVRVWNGSLVKFQNIYHEDEYSGVSPSQNLAYILGGKAEQTYLTGTLGGQGTTVAVHDVSWMPQYYGSPADAASAGLNGYTYVIMPQDYNHTSSAPSAYVPGVLQNQFEFVSVNGFSSDGNMYVQTRSLGGSTVPAGTQWPVGSVVEQYGTGFEGAVELDNVHLNAVQGPFTANGYTVHCDQTSAYTCGEIEAGYAPDIQNPTSNPATNQVGFYTPYGDPNDPVPYAQVNLHIHNVEMFNSPQNPYMGQVATHHFASIQVDGGLQLTSQESAAAVTQTASGVQIGLGGTNGGGTITAPLYTTGRVAQTTVSMPDAGEYWNSDTGYFMRKSNVFGPYQQYGNFMNGDQFENLYCLFDTPSAATNNHIANRFCVTGGPGNSGTGSYIPATGGGIEYNSWNGNQWARIFHVTGSNGVGSVSVGGDTSISGNLTSGTLTAGTVASTGMLTAASVSTPGAVTAASLAASGTVAANAVSSATVTATGTLTAGSIAAGSVATTGAVTAASIAAPTLTATSGITTGTLTASGAVSAGSLAATSVAATGAVTAGSLSTTNIAASGTITANTVSAANLSTTGSLSAGALTVSSLSSSGAVTSTSVNTGSLTATGAVTGATVTAGSVSATGNVAAGANVTASGTVSAANVNATNVTASSNVSAGSLTATTAAVAGGVSAGNLNASGAVTAASVMASGAVTAGSVTTSGTVAVGQNTLKSSSGMAVQNSLPKVAGTLAVNSSLPLVWSFNGPCDLAVGNCVESGMPLSFSVSVVIQTWSAYLMNPAAGCATPPVLALKAGNTTIATLPLANGVAGASAVNLPVTVAGGTGLQVVVSTPTVGCTDYPFGLEQSITYSAAD